MATRQVYATSAEAVGGGWSYNGPMIVTGIGYGGAATSTTSWYGEKAVQCGGKLCATGSDTTVLLASINQVESGVTGRSVSASCEDVGFVGHV